MINAHVHIGYEGYTSWGAENYTPHNVLDHLQREAFYGVGATQSVGSSPDRTVDPVSAGSGRRQVSAGIALLLHARHGAAQRRPRRHPDEGHLGAARGLRGDHGAEARAAVQGMAARNIKSVKIWVDDRRGTYPKMTPEVYNAVIDEAHKHQMLVHAHAIALADQKAVVRAGVDVLVHTVGNEKLDEEFLALLREKKPYWTTVIGLGDRSEVCDHDPFVDQSYPAKALEAIREESCGPRPPNAGRPRRDPREQRPEDGRRRRPPGARHRRRHRCAPRLRLGGSSRDRALGPARCLTPAQAIVAATSRPAELLGIDRHGHARRRQERRLRRARRQPARRHPQHPRDRERLLARRDARSRRSAGEMEERRPLAVERRSQK